MLDDEVIERLRAERVESCRAELLRRMKERYGNLTDEVVARVHAGTYEDLSRWHDRVAHSKSAAEMFAWMSTAMKLFQRGFIEGLAAEQTGFILRVMQERYGPLTAETVERMRAAICAQFDRWHDGIQPRSARELLDNG